MLANVSGIKYRAEAMVVLSRWPVAVLQHLLTAVSIVVIAEVAIGAERSSFQFPL
jgi:hypothetical protein